MQTSSHCFVNDSFELKPTRNGVLNGKTFVVKDCLTIRGHTSSFGHPAWRASSNPGTQTAQVVSCLLAEGARMSGLVKLDQLTYSLSGNVGEGPAPINPLYPDRFTGGSSSGTASAVAGLFADFGVGTDTGGSVRVPASYCGLYGVRPTYGRIETTGVIPLAPSFDTVGFMAREPELLREVAVTVGLGNKASGSTIKRILLSTDCFDLVDPNVREAVDLAAHTISQALGIKIEEKTLGSLIGPSVSDLFLRLQSREIWAAHGEWATEHMQELAPNIQERLLNLCKHYAESSDGEKQTDIVSRREYAARFYELLTPGTIFIKPITSTLPPLRAKKEPSKLRENTFLLTSPAGMAGAPEVVVPVRLDNGLTFGVGLLGHRDEDMLLIDAAVKYGIRACNARRT